MSLDILVVEDDLSVSEALGYTLQQEGFAVRTAADGLSALDLFEARQPDLVILDLMLPGLSGWQLFTAFRRRGDVPVIMLTARAEEADRVAGLEMGAHDYVTKPFSMREVVARVRMVLRRATASGESDGTAVIRAGGVELDPASHEVRVQGRLVELSPREFDLLAYLMRHAGRVRTRDEIIAAVWDEEYLDRRTVDVHVRWLREKIEADPANPERVLTVRGVGYRFAGAR
ncbi:MAG TPA: response regulator transcription factor [Armatimonadota bacterium]|nr:response regulator transcription factor [Armatimonadota bacterium]